MTNVLRGRMAGLLCAGLSILLTSAATNAQGASASTRADTATLTAPERTLTLCSSERLDNCAYQYDLIKNRVLLDAATYDSASNFRWKVLAAIPAGRQGEPECSYEGEYLCSFSVSAPAPADIEAALRSTGVTDFELRDIPANGPLVSSGIILSVPSGAACILVTFSGSDTTSTVVGRMANGECI